MQRGKGEGAGVLILNAGACTTCTAAGTTRSGGVPTTKRFFRALAAVIPPTTKRFRPRKTCRRRGYGSHAPRRRNVWEPRDDETFPQKAATTKRCVLTIVGFGAQRRKRSYCKTRTGETFFRFVVVQNFQKLIFFVVRCQNKSQ